MSINEIEGGEFVLLRKWFKERWHDATGQKLGCFVDTSGVFKIIKVHLPVLLVF